MAPDNLLFDLATDILQEVVAHLTVVGVEVPDRRYVHAGQVALDAGPGLTCDDQLVVSFVPGDFQGVPGAFDESALICEQPPSVIYEIWLSRCVPLMKDKKPPSEADLTTSAQQIMQDAREVWKAVYLGHFAKTLFDDPCRLIRIQGGRVQGPEGGVTSYILGVEVGLV